MLEPHIGAVQDLHGPKFIVVCAAPHWKLVVVNSSAKGTHQAAMAGGEKTCVDVFTECVSRQCFVEA